MTNELNTHKKKDKIKWIITLVVGVILSAGVVASLVLGVLNNNTQTQQNEESVSAVTYDSNLQVKPTSTSRMALSAKLMSASADGIASIAETDETSYRLTATVLPENADDKTVDWSIAWANASSTWASGKSVTDYLAITPTSDGAVTADLVCKGAFGEQAIVTVTSRNNPQASTTATVDYRKKVTTTTTVLSGSTSDIKTWNTSSDNALYDFNNVWSDGTIDDSVSSQSISVTTSSALRTQLANTFTSSSAKKAYEATRTYTTLPYGWETFFVPGDGAGSGWYTTEGLFSFCSDEIDFGEWEVNATQYNKLRTCLSASATDLVVTINTTTTSGATYTATYNVNIDDSSLQIMVASVSGVESVTF
jgi:hypothetical protein